MVVDVGNIAEAFVSARQTARGFASYPGMVPTTLEEAYAIQDAAIAIRGSTPIGWKVGRIHAPWQESLGVNRLVGPIFSDQIQNGDAQHTVTGNIFCNGFGAAEAEFLFRVGSPPDARRAQFTLDEVADMIDAVFIGIEVASSPFSGINAMGPLVTISDFGNNNGLVIGEEIPDWRECGLDEWTVTAQIDGKPVGQGRASSFPEGLLGSVRFLIENLIARQIAVAPGLLVSTGAVTGVHEIGADQLFEAQFGGFGRIACRTDYATR